VLGLLGKTTWRAPRWLEARLPHVNIEGSTARALPVFDATDLAETPRTDPVILKVSLNGHSAPNRG